MRDDVSMIFDMLELIMGPNSKVPAGDDDDDEDRDRAKEYDKLLESRKVRVTRVPEHIEFLCAMQVYTIMKTMQPYVLLLICI